MEELLPVLKNYGPLGGLAIFLVWQGVKILKRQDERNNLLDTFIKEKLIAISEKSIKVAGQCSKAVEENTKVVENNTKALIKNSDTIEKCQVYMEKEN